jgi:hypothetical protein
MRLIAWLSGRAEIAALIERYGPELEVPEWGARLRCSKCGSHNTDFVCAPHSTGGIGS